MTQGLSTSKTLRIAFAFSALALSEPGCDCEEGGVSLSTSEIEIEPTLLDLGTVPLGVLARGTITVRSVGEAPLRIDELFASGDPAFMVSVRPDEVLPPKSSGVVVIEARPSTVGQKTAALTIRSDDPTDPVEEVQLELVAVEPPACEDGNVCTNDHFDTTTASCRHEFADGAACQPRDRCIIEARCQSGVCLGKQKTCDDRSVCTRDLCRQIDGECLFSPLPVPCDDQNDCTIDLCGADGCLHEPASNGSPCDDEDACSQDDSCFAGLCVGQASFEGSSCDDADSCTENDRCQTGRCRGESIVAPAPEGGRVFEFPLTVWPGGAFVHRREVSLGEQGLFYGLDHLRLDQAAGEANGLTHLIFTFSQCGTRGYEFTYRPPDNLVFVTRVRREMQLGDDGSLRIVVGVRQLPEDGFQPQTTSYVLDPLGNITQASVRALGGETGRSLLPDRSHIFGWIWPLNDSTDPQLALQNLVIVREDRTGQVLWRHERSSEIWAEFLGVAGPRVLFWSNGFFGALDFNTGQPAWTKQTTFIADEMALSTGLNLGVARVGTTFPSSQILGVELIQGNEVFLFPAQEDPDYFPQTDPVIAADGRILVAMQRRGPVDHDGLPETPAMQGAVGLEWVELTSDGSLLSSTPLPYLFPPDFGLTRGEDRDDPYPTVADDGVTYVGYGDTFMALDPGGGVRWILTSTMPGAFTGTVPLLREDGVLLINEGSRKILGIKTNGGKMSAQGWASFRHDGRRTRFTP